MATTLGNGSVTFGDSTTLTTTSIPYTNVTNPKTALSQFTNDLGNYGGWFTPGNIYTGTVSNGVPWPSMAIVISGSTLTLAYNNCNCQCACNC